MPAYQKHFTLKEAMSSLPDLRRRLLRIQNLLADAGAKAGGRAVDAPIILRGNGRGPVIEGGGGEVDEAKRLIQEIADMGIHIKDIAQGLVDFPHYLDGDQDHEVFLCWRLSEDTIEYWHEIEAGFAGRVRL